MVELADIFRRYGPLYRARFGSRMLPSHIRVMQDIIDCRTPRLGGQTYQCNNPECQKLVYSYHSCGNRNCPKCGQDRTGKWLLKQKKRLLPVPYFLVTFTLPVQLRTIARSNQKCVYNLLFKSSAAALQKLAQDQKFIGGTIGMMGGLHTWTRDMRYHPHVHYIIPAGGLSPDHTRWQAANDAFLLPVKALSLIFRAKFRDALKKTHLFKSVPNDVWYKDWVVHCKPVGDGTRALKYLAPYVYRVAITDNRIVKLENGQVSFRVKDSTTGQWKTETIPAIEFIRRFLQHVVPKGFVKIRYYGLFAPANRNQLAIVKYILGKIDSDDIPSPASSKYCCPDCGGSMVVTGNLQNFNKGPPCVL